VCVFEQNKNGISAYISRGSLKDAEALTLARSKWRNILACHVLAIICTVMLVV